MLSLWDVLFEGVVEGERKTDISKYPTDVETYNYFFMLFLFCNFYADVLYNPARSRHN
jgi:hypothetical protein